MKPLNYSETIEQQIHIPLPPDFNYELPDESLFHWEHLSYLFPPLPLGSLI